MATVVRRYGVLCNIRQESRLPFENWRAGLPHSVQRKIVLKSVGETILALAPFGEAEFIRKNFS